MHDLDLDLDIDLARATDASVRLTPRQRALLLVALYLASLAALLLAGVWAAPASAVGAEATAPNGMVTTSAGTSPVQAR